jgi:hypothetical protein
MTDPVTLPRKRYSCRVSVCAACDRLYETARAHAITCSGACRVWLHRHRERYDALVAVCAASGTKPNLVLDCQAIKQLCPELETQIRDGTLEIPDTREQVHREYMRRFIAAAREAQRGAAA